MQPFEGEIFVVDNNSTDGSKEFFQNKFPQVTFILNIENEGFAKANNRALSMAAGEYILFLNPDTILPEDCLEKCIGFVQSKNNSIACGIKMIDGAGKFLKESKRAFPSPLTSLFKLSGLAYIFPKSRIFSKYHLGYLNENVNHEVDVLAGAFIMVPKKIIDAIGSFDEKFFMYGEDIDLSYRIQKAGYKNFYFAESAIIHFKGESTKKGSLNYVKMFYNAMNVFVKKHYGGTRARLFIFFIQSAIIFRAMLSAVARFLKWIGLPVIDAAIIFMSFKIIKFVWNNYVKRDVNYSPNLLSIAFPAFTLLFLAASYFAGLYDNGYKQSRLNRSTATAMLVLLSAYSLLPESLRFSRGILLFGSLLAFVLMTIIRWLLLKWNIINSSKVSDENQTIIAGSEQEYCEVGALLNKAGIHKKILGRIAVTQHDEPNTISAFNSLSRIVKLYAINEVIFCEGELSLKKIINTISNLQKRVSIKLYAAGMATVIGSDNKNETGYYISQDKIFRLSLPVSKRNKVLTDTVIAAIFIITFPFHLIMKRKPATFFKNIFHILFFKKTFIGYALPENNLPCIKPGILTTTGLPTYMNTLPADNLYAIDTLYAKNFDVLNDIKMIWYNYKLLS